MGKADFTFGVGVFVGTAISSLFRGNWGNSYPAFEERGKWKRKLTPPLKR